MRLLRDLWATSPLRTAVVAGLIVLGAGGQAAAAALAGPVLVDRSTVLFAVLAAALVAVVLSDLAVGLLAAGLTADWAADLRRRLCRVAFGQDLPTLEATPVGELLDRIDGDVYQVASEVRGAGIRIAQALATGLLSIVTALLVWWPAGVAMLVVTLVLAAALSGPIRRVSPARIDEEEAWSDLAAVMEESIHGQDDVRTSLARPFVLRLYAQRASRVLEMGRRVWTVSARVTTIASGVIRVGIAAVVVGGVWALSADRISGARLTAIWLLALAFGGTVEQVSRMVPELQYALGAWCRVQLLRAAAQEPAGGAAPVDGDLAVRGLTFRYPVNESGAERPAALREVDLTFVRGRSYAADRAHRVGQVHPDQGAHPCRRRAARHGVPRRDRPARPGPRRAAPLGRRGPAAHRDPRRHARRERRAVRPGAARAGRPGAGGAGPGRLGRPTCPTGCRPGSATAATCCRPGRSSWSRSPGSWSATRTW